MVVKYGQHWYKPRDIAKLGLIVNSKGSNSEQGNYQYILKLIKSGQLKAKNYSTGDKMPYWLVSEEEILKYHDIK